MALSTLTYLVFLAVVAVAHWLMPPKYRNFWLLAASVGFFALAMPAETVVMMVYVAVVFFLGFAVAKTKGALRRVTFISGILVSVAFLFTYKYVGFAFSLFGADRPFSLVAPMGISYVTFQCIAYLTEIYKGNMKCETGAVDFFLYSLFFAKLTAGPIEPPAEFLSRLKPERRFSQANAANGAMLIASGMLKKLAVADLLAVGVNAVYADIAGAGAWATILAAVMYSGQIYFDFSGYTDIARGSAMILGIRLTENFNKPYSAVSIRDFWHRWHISLSSWLTKYVYIPLGGSRVGTVRRYLNIAVTFLVSGLWHGASLTFVVWGLLHGLYQMIEIALSPAAKRLCERLHIGEDSLLLSIFRKARTFILVTVAWVFFRAATVGDAIAVLTKPFVSWGSIGDALELCGITLPAVLLIIFGYMAVTILRRDAIVTPSSRFYEAYHTPTRIILTVALTAWAAVLLFLVITAMGGGSSFIYFDF